MVDIVSIIIGIISLWIGIIGAIYTYKAYSKERSLKTISWGDIQNGTKYIWKKLNGLTYKPDIMISPDPKGGIIAFILSQFFDYNILMDVGQAIRKGINFNNIYNKGSYVIVHTNRWEVLLSKQIENQENKEKIKVLIVDDFVLSGDFNSKLIEVLLSLGYKRENIKVCCLAVTKVAISSNKAPDLYWKVVDDEEFYFPWGKAE